MRRISAVFFVLFLAFGFAFTQDVSFAGQAKGAIEDIQSINPSQVCMINNTVMGKPQIPVEVNGKTYYGCCEGCVSKLKGKKEARYSKDPLTGKEVDKATAFITGSPNGEALYFESRENAKKYMADLKK